MTSKRNKCRTCKEMDRNNFLQRSSSMDVKNSIDRLVVPIINYVKILGLFPANRRTGIWGQFIQTCHLLYLVAIIILLITIQVCFLVALFTVRFKLDTQFLQRLGNTVWVTESVVSFIYLIYWRHGKYLETVWSMLQKSTNHDGLKTFYKKLKLLEIISLLTLTFFIICHMVYSLEVLKIYNFGFNRNRQLEIIVLFDRPYINFLGLFGTFYLSNSWGLATFIYGFLCYCFLIEYKTMNKKFKYELTITKEVIDGYVKSYNSLREVVEKANEGFSGYIFIMLFCNVCLVIILLYGALTVPHVHFAQYGFLGAWLFCSLLQIWGLSWLPAMVNDEVRKLGELMYRSLYEQNIEPNSEMFQTVTTFVLRNINYPIGIEAGSIFYMTKGLLLTIASLIITYLTLMIDAASDVDSEALCLVLTRFFEHVTHLILYERQVYHSSTFKFHLNNNIPHPVCYYPDVVDYIKRSISSTNKLLIDQYFKSYAISIKNKNNITIEKFMFRINSLKFPEKDSITSESFLFLDDVVRKFRSKLLFMKPCILKNEDVTFVIELLSSDNILTRMPEDLKIVSMEIETARCIIPLCSVVSQLVVMEVYCEVK